VTNMLADVYPLRERLKSGGISWEDALTPYVNPTYPTSDRPEV
jgi:hypothetical protein